MNHRNNLIALFVLLLQEKWDDNQIDGKVRRKEGKGEGKKAKESS